MSMLGLGMALSSLPATLGYAQLNNINNNSRFAEESAEQSISERTLAREVLSRSGVGGILAQIPLWIDEEVAHLKLTGIPLSDAEMRDINEYLAKYFIGEPISERLNDQVAKQFDAEALYDLQALLIDPMVLQFQTMMEDAERDYVRGEIRAYKAKLKQRKLSGERLDLLRELSSLMQVALFEADVKLQLRKSVLSALSWVKNGEVVKETALDRELSQYHQRLLADLQANQDTYLLYLFRRVPTARLQRLVKLYGNPEYAQLLKQCRMVVNGDATLAREQAREDTRAMVY